MDKPDKLGLREHSDRTGNDDDRPDGQVASGSIADVGIAREDSSGRGNVLSEGAIGTGGLAAAIAGVCLLPLSSLSWILFAIGIGLWIGSAAWFVVRKSAGRTHELKLLLFQVYTLILLVLVCAVIALIVFAARFVLRRFGLSEYWLILLFVIPIEFTPIRLMGVWPIRNLLQPWRRLVEELVTLETNRG